MKVKLHFNRINMARKLSGVWSAHTHKACNSSSEVLIKYNGKIIGKTVFNPGAKQPRAYVEFFGNVTYDGDKAAVEINGQ